MAVRLAQANVLDSGRAVSSPLGWLIILFMVWCFLVGGSSRLDMGSAASIRAIGAVLVTISLAFWSRPIWSRFHLPVILLLACVALVGVQLIPLPSDWLSSGPGAQLIRDIDRAAGVEDGWTPSTLTPDATWNAFWSLLVPAAIFCSLPLLAANAHRWLLVAIVGLGGLSGLIGLMQTLGGPDSPLYVYQFTNRGVSVGLFANRNHQAAFLAALMPFAAALIVSIWPIEKTSASRDRGGPPRQVVAAIPVAMILVIFVLATGSRSGSATSIIGLASMAYVLRGDGNTLHHAEPNTKKVWHSAAWVAGAAAIAVALSIWFDRALAVDRLFGSSVADDMRYKVVPVLREMLSDAWPLGHGYGSFEVVYQLYEPAELLNPTYLNHAHNDWIEILLGGGLPALLMMVIAVGLWLTRSIMIERAQFGDRLQPLRRASLAALLIFALASLSDYPLRTPALLVVFSIAVIWASLPPKPMTEGRVGPS